MGHHDVVPRWRTPACADCHPVPSVAVPQTHALWQLYGSVVVVVVVIIIVVVVVVVESGMWSLLFLLDVCQCARRILHRL